ncbi:MAG: ribonuclease HI family protein [Sulfobacillus sp.]
MKLYTDGAARGNPGPAAAGMVIEDDQGQVIWKEGRYLGETTNNVAEYQALLWGLEKAASLAPGALLIRMDSELVIKQLTGVYRVKHPALRPLHQQALALLSRFPSWRAEHVRREKNSLADHLANLALDRKLGVRPGTD